ncbi:hypothetical protein Fleli_3686 [Bernardetia litoralis DSM 6794]|uniref:Uncharacterized protein n=1 Tax=Bernardetia litoralis (strain ATCC 23117 / DSM 6794 / NBRC 15988 / NCIMB 1366 / Fx l1 / Sio-4) TaxID=880071 RepID=I4APW5_BERLS|nr:hypothetical protein [Bernardetia litoralis]AFM06000.1 hypothetical protein Fleli_3686 [Bernardetia litoralis DSM 6794]
MGLHLERLQIQLKKCYPYIENWRRKQNDIWDKQTNFIYKVRHFQTLENHLKDSFKENPNFEEIRIYALNRWYNFWSAQGIETIFCSYPNVKPHSDPYHQFIDFWIDEIPFDHKTSVFPKRYTQNIEFAKKNPIDLLRWLYENQSKQKRFHLRNRLFLILYRKDGNHQRLKSEIEYIKPIIENYLKYFDFNNLKKLEFKTDKGIKTAYSDCIFIEM